MLGKTKILLVDDEKRFRETWHRLLTGRGYDVITAENGQIALDILSESRVNIIILDLKMPVMSGEEALEVIAKEYPDIPVVIITGNGTIDTAVECMKKGAYDFLTKPFEVDQLLFIIRRAEDKRTLEQKDRISRDMIIRILHDLNAEKKRLKTIINCMANGILVTNRNLEVLAWLPPVMLLGGAE